MPMTPHTEQHFTASDSVRDMVIGMADGKVFDMPPQTVQRYLVNKQASAQHPGRVNHKCRRLPTGRVLRIELLTPARVHWTTVQDLVTTASGFGIHCADLPTGKMKNGTALAFTFYWPEADRWEETDFSVGVE